MVVMLVRTSVTVVIDLLFVVREAPSVAACKLCQGLIETVRR